MSELVDLPSIEGHEPHVRETRRHTYLFCSCGAFDIRVPRPESLPWYRWGQHLDEQRVDA